MLGFLQSKDNRKERKKSSKGGRRTGSGRKRKAGTAESTMSEVISGLSSSSKRHTTSWMCLCATCRTCGCVSLL